MKDMKKLCDLITNIKKPSSASNANTMLKSVELFTDIVLGLTTCAMSLNHQYFEMDKHFFNVDEIGTSPSVDPILFDKGMSAAIYFIEMIKEREAFSDILAETFEAIYLTGKSGDGLSQFLSPTDIANLIADLSLSKYDGKDNIFINDDCCGAGSLVLPFIRKSIKPNDSYIDKKIHLNDIDPLMVKMAIIQIMAPVAFKMYDLNRVIAFTGNVLTLDSKAVFKYESNKGKVNVSNKALKRIKELCL